MPQKFVNLENLTSFWGNAKEYIGNERKEIEDQLYNWQKTEKAPIVQCEPVPNSELHPVVEFKFKETLSEGEKSPSNPSTIVGINNIRVSLSGLNLIKFPYSVETQTKNNVTFTINSDGSIKVNGTASADTYFWIVPNSATDSIYLNGGNTYYVSGCPANGSVNTYSIRCNVYSNNINMFNFDEIGNSYTFTPTDSTRRLAVSIKIASGYTANNLIFKPKIEKDAISSDFEKGYFHNVFLSLGNTYYGGSIDLSTGLMTVIWGGKEITGTENWGLASASTSEVNEFYVGADSGFLLMTNTILTSTRSCSHFRLGNASIVANTFYTWGSTTRVMIRMSVSDMADVTAFKSWLASEYAAGHPVTFTYMLNTPFTVQLTPQQIKSLPSLEGTSKRINTVYTDANSVQVKYQKYVGIDSTLDNNSVNAIQNKVVNSALNTKANDSETVHLTGNEQIAGVKEFTSSPQVPVPTANNDAVPMIWVKDMLRTEVEKLTDSRNTIVRDSNDNPHYMVVIPRFNIEDAFGTTAYGTGVHDMFKIGDKVASEILIGKYHCTKLTGDVAATLPHANPWTNINFDNAVTACRALGINFALCPDIVYAGYVLKIAKTLGDSYQYHGNTNYGRDSVDHSQTGTFATATELSYGDTGISDPVTLTGSGPKEWYSDDTFLGVADLAGNITEWTSGLRIVDGEFQFIPNNDSMLSTVDFSASSTDWKAVLSDGSFVTPGTVDTIKGDGNAADTGSNWSIAGTWNLNTALVNQNVNGYYIGNFSNIAAASGVTIPSLFVRAGILPYSGATTKLCNWFAMCNKGEKLAHLGSSWYGSYGPLRTYLSDVRTYSTRAVGFRLAFCAFS